MLFMAGVICALSGIVTVDDVRKGVERSRVLRMSVDEDMKVHAALRFATKNETSVAPANKDGTFDWNGAVDTVSLEAWCNGQIPKNWDGVTAELCTCFLTAQYTTSVADVDSVVNFVLGVKRVSHHLQQDLKWNQRTKVDLVTSSRDMIYFMTHMQYFVTEYGAKTPSKKGIEILREWHPYICRWYGELKASAGKTGRNREVLNEVATCLVMSDRFVALPPPRPNFWKTVPLTLMGQVDQAAISSAKPGSKTPVNTHPTTTTAKAKLFEDWHVHITQAMLWAVCMRRMKDPPRDDDHPMGV